MRTVWKVVSVLLFAGFFALFLVCVSMYWWPNIPAEPRPLERRTYALNNHGHYTYLNRSEFLLRQSSFLICPMLLASFAAIHFAVDPFGEKEKRRLYDPPPQY
jgi:hypothetical protein